MDLFIMWCYRCLLIMETKKERQASIQEKKYILKSKNQELYNISRFLLNGYSITKINLVWNFLFIRPLRRRERASCLKRTDFSKSPYQVAHITLRILLNIYSSIKLNSILYLSSSVASELSINLKTLKITSMKKRS